MDEEFMQEAIKLAKMGAGHTNPNPMVGAVIVKNGQIIGRGYHKQYGGLHAEREAIANCIESGNEEKMAEATIYVTLEPCCHTGKQPPCTDALIKAGFVRVVIGSFDPNPLVAGKGVRILQEAGIKVDGPVCEKECLKINKIFFHYITHKKPLVTLKVAETLDGKICTYSGKSKWITGDKAREKVHYDRNLNMAILVGVGTVLADNPMLNCRTTIVDNPRNPIRIVCDYHLRTPIDSNLVITANDIPTWIFTGEQNEKKLLPYKNVGVKIINDARFNNKKEGISLAEIIGYLGEKGIDSLIIEGGGQINFSALNEKIVDKVQVYMAPKIFGGKDAKTGVEGCGVETPDDAYLLENLEIEKLGVDYLFEGDVRYSN